MLDCNGQSDPTVTSQYLALYQVLHCCRLTERHIVHVFNYWNNYKMHIAWIKCKQLLWRIILSLNKIIGLTPFSQSCCTVAMAAKLLNCACADTSVSQLSALLSLHRNLFVSQEMRSSSMLKRSEEQLLHLFKVQGHEAPLMIYRCCHTQSTKLSSWVA